MGQGDHIPYYTRGMLASLLRNRQVLCSPPLWENKTHMYCS